MTGTAIYTDSFFTTIGEQSEFLDFLRERDANGKWERRGTKEIRVAALDKTNPEIAKLWEQYEDADKQAVLEDTMENTCLLLKIDEDYYPVRSCAVKTILDRARISGHALKRLKKPVLAEILNHCLQVARGDALVRFSEDKVSALHGGDESDYSILAIPELFERTVAYLNQRFPGYTFAGGFYDHMNVSATWELTKDDALASSYLDALRRHDKEVDEVHPAISLSTSDVGVSSVYIKPKLLLGKEGKAIVLGSPLRLEHSQTSMADFEQELRLTFSQFLKAVDNLNKLLTVEIRRPANCMQGVMKKCGFGKKLTMETIELFKAQVGEDPCSAHDIYLGISEAIFNAQCEGASGTRLLNMEEDAAKALSLNWREYDIPGVLAW